MVCAGSAVTLTGCTFLANTAGYQGGGGVGCYGASVTLTSCTFSGNTGTVNGGGIDCHGSSVVLNDCAFVGNDAEDGGGILSSESSLALTDCIFSANTASCRGSRDTGRYDSRGFVPTLTSYTFPREQPYSGGGMACGNGSDVTLANCTFSDNYAEDGDGGMGCYSDSDVTLANCTFFANSAGHQGGGGMGCHGSSTTLTNCIIAFCGSEGAVRCTEGGSATLFCSNVYGNVGGDWVDCIEGQGMLNGNLSEDPLFCDPSSGDLTLHTGSPCLPGHNPGCGLIGASGVGCPATGVGELVEETSWSAIKAVFR
jgi:predicted outer membrane repeat protein